MNRGRPIKSEIRQNIVDIIYITGDNYGYDIYRIYRHIFPKCTPEVIYYHLKKGTELGEFVLKEIKKEEGNYSWGPTAEKRYYALGPNASPRVNEKIRKLVEEEKLHKKRK